MKTPEGLKYAKTDEWVKMDGKIATVGISDYAQDQLSDIVFIEFNREIDDAVAKGDATGNRGICESCCGCQLTCQRQGIGSQRRFIRYIPETMNDDPYEKGWLYKIELSNPDEIKDLMMRNPTMNICEGRD